MNHRIRTIIFLTATVTFGLTGFSAHSQNWQDFLERHVDQLHDADTAPGLEARYSDSIIAVKKEEALSRTYQSSKGKFDDAGGHCNPGLYGRHDIYKKGDMDNILATLVKGSDPYRQNALNMLHNTMLNYGFNGRGKGADFVNYWVAYIMNIHPWAITGQKEVDLKNHFSENPVGMFGEHFWEYNTPNHCQMHRSTTYGVGLKWPDSTFIVRENGSRETGTYMYRQIEEKHIKKYIHHLYRYGSGENLSPVYLGVHLQPWTVFYELARKHKRKVPQEISGAILEYYHALCALNNQHRMYAGMVNRARPESVENNYNRELISRLYGGYGVDETPGGSPLFAESSYVPTLQTRRMIAGDVRMPYTFLQTCAINGWYKTQVPIADMGKVFGFNHGYAKTDFRYVYVHRQYSLGTGNVKIIPGTDYDYPRDGIDYPDGIAGSASWDGGFMIFSSPDRHVTERWGDKFFRNHEPGYKGLVGEDSWVGYSPHMQMAQFKDAAIVYCIIPSREVYRLAQVHLSDPGGSDILENDEVHQAYYGRYPAGEGFVYFALIPLHHTSDNLRSSGFKNVIRFVDYPSGEEGHCGYVVEMAHSREMSYDEFKNRANRSNLIWNKEQSQIIYTNRYGDRISMQHTGSNPQLLNLPVIGITPFAGDTVTVNWDAYPSVRSPYMKVVKENGRPKLIINDNQSGLKIDYNGSRLSYETCNDFVPVNIPKDTMPVFDKYVLQLEFLDPASGDPLTGMEVRINGRSYMVDSVGLITTDSIPGGYYRVTLPGGDYAPSDKGLIGIRSDSLIRMQLTDIPNFAIKILDRATKKPVNRARVLLNGNLYFTGENGVIDFGRFEPGPVSYKVDHFDYFSLSDSTNIGADTTLTLLLTGTLADITFILGDAGGPMSFTPVRLDGRELLTDDQGRVTFYQVASRVAHIYEVAVDDYYRVSDTVIPETDTTLSIRLVTVGTDIPGNMPGLRVYPNPFSGTLHIDLHRKGRLEVYDLPGTLQKNIRLTNGLNMITTPELSDGGYILRIISGTKIRNMMIVKSSHMTIF